MPIAVGDVVEGVILKVMQYGIFIQLDENKKGLVHISEVSNKFIENLNTEFVEGQIVKAKVISIENSKIALSIKQLEEKPKFEKKERKFNNNTYDKKKNNNSSNGGVQTFEDILTKFMKDSEERQIDIKRSFEAKRGSSGKKM